jgi:hypothetical protein
LREAMDTREFDLAVNYFPDLSTQPFFKQRLYRHSYACMPGQTTCRRPRGPRR